MVQVIIISMILFKAARGQKANAMERRFLSNMSNCEICSQSYDQKGYKPMLVCNNQHTICKKCLSDLKNPPICPFCRESIDRGRVLPNNLILNQIEASQSKSHIQEQKIEKSIWQKQNPKKKSVVYPLQYTQNYIHENSHCFQEPKHRQSVVNVGVQRHQTIGERENYQEIKKTSCFILVIYALVNCGMFCFTLLNLYLGINDWSNCNEGVSRKQMSRLFLLILGCGELIWFLLTIFLMLKVFCCKCSCDYILGCQIVLCLALTLISSLLDIVMTAQNSLYLKNCYCKGIFIADYVMTSTMLCIMLFMLSIVLFKDMNKICQD